MGLETEQKQHRPDARLAIGIVSFALLLRLLFVAQVLRENSVARIAAFNWDSREYLHLSHNLASGQGYVVDTDGATSVAGAEGSNPDPFAQLVPTQVSHHFGLLRTPGYPAFCAVFEYFGVLGSGVLIVQAILGALIPLGVFHLGYAIWRNHVAATIAAVFSAVSSTGIGLSGIFLVDLLLALCVLGGFSCLYSAIVREKRSAYVAAGLFFSLGLLVKPTLLYWPIFIPPVALLLARGLDARFDWRNLAITMLLPWITVAIWCARNKAVEDSFTFCSVDAQNLRHFLAPLVEESAKASGRPAMADIWRNHYTARNRDWDDLQSRRLTPVQITARQRAESLVILRQHPFLTIASVFKNAFDCSISGWAYTRLQTPSFSPIEEWVRYSDRYLFFFGMFPCYILVLLSIAEPLLSDQGLRAPENRRRFFLHAALLLTLGYFFVLSGTSFSAGFRILYPAEFALILLTVSGALAAIRLLTPAAEREAELITEMP